MVALRLHRLPSAVCIAILAASCGVLTSRLTGAAEKAMDNAEGGIHVPAFVLPDSSLREGPKPTDLLASPAGVACPAADGSDRQAMATWRQCNAERFATSPSFVRVLAHYPVRISFEVMGGVSTEVFTPKEGVDFLNTDRVLINLHGGHFVAGSRTQSRLESVPISAVGKIKVISIDYRMAPEYAFPSASEDVAAVYREVLKTYKPENIGMYGSSAGGLLTAESIAWFQKERLALPAAIGLFSGGASYYQDGDSAPMAAAIEGFPLQPPSVHPYFKGADPADPLAFPIRSQAMLARFPPTLLIASTRDVAMSSVVRTHEELLQLGVEAQLRIWEGLEHTFYLDPHLPASHEVFDAVVQFFAQHLGKPADISLGSRNITLEANLAAEIDHFRAADTASMPMGCQILFIGSSSIVKWQALSKDMAPLAVLNRGFGGSHIAHINRWFDDIVTPYHPRAIVLYAGENDLAAGKSVEQVIADFDQFMTRKTAAFAATPVYFISIKPSKLRWSQYDLQSAVNAAIRVRAENRSDLRFIDVVPDMLDHGLPRDLYVADGLHMSAKGYEIWTKAVHRALSASRKAADKTCH